mmetsp:Transcript_8797/g.30094  ORF Transcript_8797/g.30094 Transcript_8797/m.30094 type:complete len:315 (-) Transcript_8797:4-948(-)
MNTQVEADDDVAVPRVGREPRETVLHVRRIRPRLDLFRPRLGLEVRDLLPHLRHGAPRKRRGLAVVGLAEQRALVVPGRRPVVAARDEADERREERLLGPLDLQRRRVLRRDEAGRQRLEDVAADRPGDRVEPPDVQRRRDEHLADVVARRVLALPRLGVAHLPIQRVERVARGRRVRAVAGLGFLAEGLAVGVAQLGERDAELAAADLARDAEAEALAGLDAVLERRVVVAEDDVVGEAVARGHVLHGEADDRALLRKNASRGALDGRRAPQVREVAEVRAPGAEVGLDVRREDVVDDLCANRPLVWDVPTNL